MAITSVRTAAGFPHPRCCVGMALRVGHHGITLVSCQEVSSGQAGGCTIAGPSKGPDRNRKVKTQNQEDYERQTPGTVKLWESPGRAGVYHD